MPYHNYVFPWRFLPAHLFLHLGVFVSAILWLILEPEPMVGMSGLVHDIWIMIGLIAGPLMWLSYHIIFLTKAGGKAKYIAVVSHFLANFMATFYIGGYLLSDWHTVIQGDQDLPAYVITITALVFLIILVINDVINISKLERMATVMMAEEESNGP